MGRYTESNKYNATPRKVFDKHVDRMEIKRQRDKEDHRADIKALLRRIQNLENQLSLLNEHVESHCALTGPPPFETGNQRRESGNEGLE